MILGEKMVLRLHYREEIQTRVIVYALERDRKWQ